MKKLSIFILLLSSTLFLQSSQSRKKKSTNNNAVTETATGGDSCSPPVAHQVITKISPVLLPAPAPSANNSPKISPRSLHESPSFHNFTSNEIAPQFPNTPMCVNQNLSTEKEHEHAATACQTTMQQFSYHTALLTKERSRQPSLNDLDLVDQKEVNELETAARDKQTIAEKAIEILQTVGDVTQTFLLSVSQQELPRILQLDNQLKLTNYLNSFASDDQKGEWLTRGLIQAVESKSIDATTQMLHIIHRYKLTNFIPAAHQNSAADLLSAHNKTAIILILPLTQRNAQIGSLSPRSQSIQKQLEDMRTSYGYNPKDKQDQLLIEQIRAQLKEFGIHKTSSAISEKK